MQIVTRNSKFVTANVLNPVLSVKSSKLRSVGTNTIQELLTCLSLQKESQKKNITNLPSEDKSTK